MKAYEAETAYNQVVIDSATYVLKVTLSLLPHMAALPNKDLHPAKNGGPRKCQSVNIHSQYSQNHEYCYQHTNLIHSHKIGTPHRSHICWVMLKVCLGIDWGLRLGKTTEETADSRLRPGLHRGVFTSNSELLLVIHNVSRCMYVHKHTSTSRPRSRCPIGQGVLLNSLIKTAFGSGGLILIWYACMCSVHVLSNEVITQSIRHWHSQSSSNLTFSAS